MHNAFCVKCSERGKYIADYLLGLAPCQRTDNRMEQVHRVEWVFAFGLENVDSDDPRMRELCEAASFGYEAPSQPGRFPFGNCFARCENLHCKVGVQRFVMDPPHFAGRAASEERDDAKAAECFAWMQKISLSRFGLVQGGI